MRRPVEHLLRQDEMRRAHEVRIESEPGFVKQPPPAATDVERTIADDCAVMLEVWWRKNPEPTCDDVTRLGRQMRAMGMLAKYSTAVKKL